MEPQPKIISHYLDDKAGMSSVNAETIAKKIA